MDNSSFAFAPQLRTPEQWGRQIKVLLGNSKEQATCTLGKASFRIQSRTGAPNDFIMVPTASVWRRGCTVAINGTYPPEVTMLTLGSEADAAALQEQLESIAIDVVLSLHSRLPRRCPIGAPISLEPIKHAARGTPKEPGQLCICAYVVVSMGHGAFLLHWAELCGPDPNGVVAIHFYCSDTEYAMFTDYLPIMGVDTMQVQGNVMKVETQTDPHTPPGGRGNIRAEDEYVIFRSAEEAQMWAETASNAMDLHGRQRRERPLPAGRKERVVSDIKRRAAPKSPLLREMEPVPARGNGAVTDAVANHTRRRETARMREMALALMNMEDNDDAFGGPSGTTVYDPSGTTQYHFGTNSASGTTQYHFGTTHYHGGTTRNNFNGSNRGWA